MSLKNSKMKCLLGQTNACNIIMSLAQPLLISISTTSLENAMEEFQLQTMRISHILMLVAILLKAEDLKENNQKRRDSLPEIILHGFSID